MTTDRSAHTMSAGSGALLLAILASAACDPGPAAAPATWVGTTACVGCHEAEAAAWTGSHHDLAMQVPTAESVLGDFSDVTFTGDGAETTFFRRDGAWWVRAEGPDGKPSEYRVAWTFGAYPLQQYILEFGEGRYQALTVAWDSRPAADGGQRWYSLYPGEEIRPGDRLHWTGPEQNWNYQCAACHSTELRKSHDPTTGRYATTWSDIDVGCEACHGPGSIHVGLAERLTPGDTAMPETGLAADLADRDGGVWTMGSGARVAARTPARARHTGIAACAACHSRRQLIEEVPVADTSVLDGVRPALLTEGLYHADGQILAEVYVLGSFLQSLMYLRGVTCADCHDPHGLRVRAPGNPLCGRCHLPTAYDTPQHHHHESGSAASECIACHMPARTYMGVDVRRDHSFRVPQPRLSDELGTPDACADCHADGPAGWASAAVDRWYGTDRPARYGEVLARARNAGSGAGAALADLAGDTAAPGIVRATALELLARHPGGAAEGAIVAGAAAADPWVRYGAVLASEAVPPAGRAALLGRLLRDPVKLVRIEAGRSLALLQPRAAPAVLDSVVEEYIASQRIDSDRAESHVNIANVLAARGRISEARQSLELAVRVDSAFAPGWVNLSDLLRAQGRDDEGEHLLRLALVRTSGAAAVRHALGLLLVRRGRLEEAVSELRAAAASDPGNARFAYVYGVALQSVGDVDAAIDVLARARTRHPRDIDILTALLSWYRDSGRIVEALGLAREWRELEPGNPVVQAEISRLERMRGRG